MSGAPTQIGPYEVLGELGRGGMGVVYRVRRADLDREFALKLTLEGAGGSLGTARLQREAQAAARLAGHPGIVGVHDAGQYAGAIYLVMDLVEGRGLDEVIAEEPLRPMQAAAYGEQIARAVAHAHAEGVLHRDLKPANVMVERPAPEPGGAFSETAGHGAGQSRGRVRVTDFGLAGTQQADADVTRLTQSGELLGTPAYMPPEQARGEEADGRADVYSLGATLYECIAGTPPVDGPSVFGVVAKVLKGDIEPLRDVAPHCPQALDAIVMQCLATRREDRYPSMTAVAEDLERFLAGTAVSAASPSALARATRRARRRPAVLVGGVAALVVGAAGAGWWAVRAAGTSASQQVEAATEERGAADVRVEQADAWRRLSGATADPMQVLLRTYFREGDGGTGAADVAAAMDAVNAACDAVASSHANSRLPGCWRHYARLLAGDAEALGELEAAAAEAGSDPFPSGVVALARCSIYGRLVEPPALRSSDGGTRVVARPPSTEQEAARAAARAAGRAARSADWARIEHGRELLELAQAAEAFGEGRPADAVPRLTAVLDHRLLGNLARYLRAMAAIGAAEWSKASEDIETVVLAGWVGAATIGSGALQVGGMEAAQRGEDPNPWFQRAIALLQLAAEGGLSQRTRLFNEALVRMTWAGQLEARRDPREEEQLRAAVACLTQARELRTGGPVEYHLGSAYYHLGTMLVRAQRDGRTEMAQAARYMAAGRPNDLEPWLAETRRAGVLADLAVLQSRRGGDWRATSDEALRIIRPLAEQHAGSFDALARLGRVLFQRAQCRGLSAEEADAAWAEAETAYRRALAVAPDRINARRNLVMTLLARAHRRREQRRPFVELADHAIEAAGPMAAAHPRDWSIQHLMAAAHLLRATGRTELPDILADIDAGIAAARAATTLSNHHAPAWHRLCRLLADRATVRWRAGERADDDTATALTEFQALAAKHPRYPNVHAELGDVRLESVRNRALRIGDPAPVWKAALADYERQFEATPTNARVAAACASLHQMTGNLDQARKYYETALKLRPGWKSVEEKLARLGR